MDKQQAAEKHATNDYGGTVPPFNETMYNSFEAGWEAHEAQSLTDAVALLKQVPRMLHDAADGLVNYDFLKEVHDFITINPSGAAPKTESNER